MRYTLKRFGRTSKNIASHKQIKPLSLIKAQRRHLSSLPTWTEMRCRICSSTTRRLSTCITTSWAIGLRQMAHGYKVKLICASRTMKQAENQYMRISEISIRMMFKLVGLKIWRFRIWVRSLLLEMELKNMDHWRSLILPVILTQLGTTKMTIRTSSFKVASALATSTSTATLIYISLWFWKIRTPKSEKAEAWFWSTPLVA